MVKWNSGYRIDLENRGLIKKQGRAAYKAWRRNLKDYDWEPPKQIDPREWLDTDNQGNIGSCQGNSLANAGEQCAVISDGKEIQLSRAFAYLASQEYDGINGDSGSTLSGGTKAAQRGLPLESRFPYDSSYSAMSSRYRREKSDILAGPLYRLHGALPLESYEDCLAFLSSWSGVIQIGIMWTLPNAWEITSYRGGGGGGHAVNFAGYLPVQKWGDQPGLLLHNSWGEGWGRDGWAIVKPSAVTQMLRAQWSVFVGRSDMKVPIPRTA
jgi:hypothetical protein